MVKEITKAQQKRNDTETYMQHVKKALQEAQNAARSAYQKFAETAKYTTEGAIIDTAGSARVVIYKPSYRFRTTLQALGEIERTGTGAWRISNFIGAVDQQSLNGHEAACSAAVQILEKNFPEETDIYMQSWVD